MTPTTPELPPGLRLYVLGNNLEAGGRGCSFLGARTGPLNDSTATAERGLAGRPSAADQAMRMAAARSRS